MRTGRIARVVAVSLVLLAASGCATDGGVDKAQAAKANANVGAEYLRKNQNDRAAEAFTRALGYDRSNFTANWGLAVASDRLGSPDKAQKYFEKTLSIRKSPVVYNSYAAFLCRQGQVAEGVADFQKALSTSSSADRADSLANAGLCLARNGQGEAAAGYFRRALKTDPGQATALTQLADIAYHAQDYMKARAFIERADAAKTLSADNLLLAARIEHALGDQDAEAGYLKRYNANQPGANMSPGQLESSR